MVELEELHSGDALPHGKRKERIVKIADKIIKQILKADSNLLDAQIIAEIVNIGIRDIVGTGITDGNVEPNMQLTKEQRNKLLSVGRTWGKYSRDGYSDASGHPIG
jgi:hypothetical protein